MLYLLSMLFDMFVGWLLCWLWSIIQSIRVRANRLYLGIGSPEQPRLCLPLVCPSLSANDPQINIPSLNPSILSPQLLSSFPSPCPTRSSLTEKRSRHQR